MFYFDIFEVFNKDDIFNCKKDVWRKFNDLSFDKTSL